MFYIPSKRIFHTSVKGLMYDIDVPFAIYGCTTLCDFDNSNNCRETKTHESISIA